MDVVAVLTDSKDPLAYWRKLKQRLKEEGNETVTNCHGLKMTAADGKMRLTDVADQEQLFRCAAFALALTRRGGMWYRTRHFKRQKKSERKRMTCVHRFRKYAIILAL